MAMPMINLDPRHSGQESPMAGNSAARNTPISTSKVRLADA